MRTGRRFYNLVAIASVLNLLFFLVLPLSPVDRTRSYLCSLPNWGPIHEALAPGEAHRVVYYEPCGSNGMRTVAAFALLRHDERYPKHGNLVDLPIFPRSIVWHGLRHVHIEAFVCAAADLPTTELWRDSVRVTLTPLVHDATYPAGHALTKACARKEARTVASAVGR